MASPQLDTIIETLRAQPFDETAPIADTRSGMEEFAATMPIASDIKREPVDAGGVPGEWFTPPNAGDNTTVLYLHGGGYVVGSANTHANLASRIARAVGARALSLNYRLAPEHPYPAAIADSTRAYRWLLKQGVRPNTMLIAGDSAGGGLTAATLLDLRDAGDPMPGGAVLLSPWTDLECKGDTMKTRVEADPMVRPSLLQAWAALYQDGAPGTDPFISPLHGDFKGLPPMLIQVGDAEVLLDDSRRFAQRAKAAGVDVTLEVWDDMIHVFQFFAPMLPEAQQAIDRIGEWVKQHVSAGATA